MFSLDQANFCPKHLTLNQILYLAQFVSDGYNKSRQKSQTILAMINFLKAFDSVWHPVLFS